MDASFTLLHGRGLTVGMSAWPKVLSAEDINTVRQMTLTTWQRANAFTALDTQCSHEEPWGEACAASKREPELDSGWTAAGQWAKRIDGSCPHCIVIATHATPLFLQQLWFKVQSNMVLLSESPARGRSERKPGPQSSPIQPAFQQTSTQSAATWFHSVCGPVA